MIKRPGDDHLSTKPTAEIRERIAKRVALEFKNNMYANLGIGLPMLSANYIPEGVNIHLQSENGNYSDYNQVF